eukprot:CAMPEP_0194235070 /NCGR_PEP_ID=MMETSP0158-20130606/2652_1 /TAXON_ID=33649 /ORGANISM="Thalassionema nitzschioides, Strain L26-B" /LENGTH=197 /DNA_ID=CAMNT_0038968423 /DNA_START=55 /DNA_END=648 /DNA_ORIENTATION=+
MDINPPTSNESLTFETTIRDTDDGFLIIGDSSCRNPHFPSFLPISRRICFRSFDPRKPAMLAAHNLSDDIWLAFAVDTRKVLNACYNKLYCCLFVTYLLLKMPLWFIPYLKVDNYEKYNDATIDSAYGLYTAYYFAVLIGALISAFTCLRMNGEGTHKKIKEIHNNYLEDFYNSGITLLYFRDGNAAYWIFRPTTIV